MHILLGIYVLNLLHNRENAIFKYFSVYFFDFSLHSFYSLYTKEKVKYIFMAAHSRDFIIDTMNAKCTFPVNNSNNKTASQVLICLHGLFTHIISILLYGCMHASIPIPLQILCFLWLCFNILEWQIFCIL